jgi:hypothetical protein
MLLTPARKERIALKLENEFVVAAPVEPTSSHRAVLRVQGKETRGRGIVVWKALLARVRSRAERIVGRRPSG